MLGGPVRDSRCIDSSQRVVCEGMDRGLEPAIEPVELSHR
jgi:hypothetical protein